VINNGYVHMYMYVYIYIYIYYSFAEVVFLSRYVLLKGAHRTGGGVDENDTIVDDNLVIITHINVYIYACIRICVYSIIIIRITEGRAPHGRRGRTRQHCGR